MTELDLELTSTLEANNIISIWSCDAMTICFSTAWGIIVIGIYGAVLFEIGAIMQRKHLLPEGGSWRLGGMAYQQKCL